MKTAYSLVALFATCSMGMGVAVAADAPSEPPRTAQVERACAGVVNENTKMRELRREYSAYFGQTVPDDLQDRMRKHIDQVTRMKADCDRLREQAAVAK